MAMIRTNTSCTKGIFEVETVEVVGEVCNDACTRRSQGMGESDCPS